MDIEKDSIIIFQEELKSIGWGYAKVSSIAFNF
jgi:hypothetical protein